MLRSQGLEEEIGSATEREGREDLKREEVVQNNHAGEWESE